MKTKATGSLPFLPSGFARVPIRLALRGPQNVHSATHGMQTPSRQGFHLRLCRAIGPPCVSRPAERVFCGARNAPISQQAFYLPKGSIPFGRTSSFLPRTPTEDEVAAFSAQGTPLDSKTGCGTAQVGSRPGHGAQHKTFNLRTARPRNTASCARRTLQCARSTSLRTSSAQIKILMKGSLSRSPAAFAAPSSSPHAAPPGRTEARRPRVGGLNFALWRHLGKTEIARS